MTINCRIHLSSQVIFYAKVSTLFLPLNLHTGYSILDGRKFSFSSLNLKIINWRNPLSPYVLLYSIASTLFLYLYFAHWLFCSLSTLTSITPGFTVCLSVCSSYTQYLTCQYYFLHCETRPSCACKQVKTVGVRYQCLRYIYIFLRLWILMCSRKSLRQTSILGKAKVDRLMKGDKFNN